MMHAATKFSMLALLATVLESAAGVPQVSNIWQTLHDQSSVFAPVNAQVLKSAAFTTASSIRKSDIVLDANTTYQTMQGFGATLTDSAAQSLNMLKVKNAAAYTELLKKLFDPSVNASSAGITYLRVPLGASDFAARSYSYDDTPNDISLGHFNISVAPSYVFEVLNDIQNLNNLLKVHVVPWSPPGWMKDTKTMNGGSFMSNMTNAFANYLLKALQGFESKGVHVYAISIQNEPLSSNPSLPSCQISSEQEGAIGKALKPLMKSNGFSAVQLIGYEHNWDATSYPISLMQSYSDVFDGVSFHCYGGNVADQDQFHQQYPKKDIYFTECTGMDGGGWWGDLQWQTENVLIGAVEHNAKTALMWELVSGEELPGSTSCGSGGKPNMCRAVVTLNANGTYVLNEEYYGIAQGSRAVVPMETGGAFGKRIKSTITQSKQTAGLSVNAFATPSVKKGDPTRYSLHVLNTNGTGTYTVDFQDKQLSYAFPIGVSTLWFYA